MAVNLACQRHLVPINILIRQPVLYFEIVIENIDSYCQHSVYIYNEFVTFYTGTTIFKLELSFLGKETSGGRLFIALRLMMILRN